MDCFVASLLAMTDVPQSAPLSRRFRLRLRVAPGGLQRDAKLGLVERRKLGARPTRRAPAALQRRESLRRNEAFELLLVGRKPDIGALAVRGERRENARGAKSETIEMRRLADAGQRQRYAPQIFAGRHFQTSTAQSYSGTSTSYPRERAASARRRSNVAKQCPASLLKARWSGSAANSFKAASRTSMAARAPAAHLLTKMSNSRATILTRILFFRKTELGWPAHRPACSGSAVMPAKRAFGPSASSMRNASFHFAIRSDRANEPTFNWQAAQPTARWTIVVSSVSPERAETIAPKPARRASSQAAFASLTVPAWLTFTSTALTVFSAAAARTRPALVTRKSSPITWTRPPTAAVKRMKPSA